MKRVKSVLCMLLLVVLLTACGKSYSSITYKRFTTKLGDELNYAINDQTLAYEGIYQRYYTAIKDDVFFSYYEFADEKTAKEYVKSNYEDRKYFSYKDNGKYTTVKSTKSKYFTLIQVDNMVITGYSDKSSKRSVIKKALKELGY